MTRTRARRLIRTAAALWAILALAIATGCFAHRHLADGGIASGVGVVAGLTAYFVGPRHRKPREQPVVPSRNHPAWRVEAEVARFMSEVSAWEAEQKAKP